MKYHEVLNKIEKLSKILATEKKYLARLLEKSICIRLLKAIDAYITNPNRVDKAIIDACKTYSLTAEKCIDRILLLNSRLEMLTEAKKQKELRHADKQSRALEHKESNLKLKHSIEL